MALEFRFPDVGEGIDAGELVEWYVSEGQVVREDDPMADVQTDKATVTIPCPTTGRVLELRVNVGEVVSVGAVMAVFEPAQARAQAMPADTPEPPVASPPAAGRAPSGPDTVAAEPPLGPVVAGPKPQLASP